MPKKRRRASRSKKEVKKEKKGILPVLNLNEGKVPKGIKVLVIYSIILALFYIFYFFVGIFNPKAIYVGELFKGYEILVLDFFVLVSLIFVIYGLIKRTSWGWVLAIIWYAFSIVGSIFSIFIIDTAVYGFIREMLIVSSIFIILLDGLIIWYLGAKKSYFVSKHLHSQYANSDRIFVYTLVSFWVVLIFLTLTIGIKFYQNTTDVADEIVFELQGTSIMHAFVICEEKEGQDRDVCYVVLATMFTDQDLGTICSRIDSDFYRLTCLQIR